MQDRDFEVQRERELDKMINRLERVMEKDREMRLKLEEAGVSPSHKNVTHLLQLMEGMGESISDAMSNLEYF